MELKRTLKYLRKDVWAQISAIYIFLVIIVATFAYQLAPDKTRNANQMHLSIHSKWHDFSYLLLIIPRNTSTTRKRFFNGTITSNEEIPIKDISWVNDGILFKRYGNATDYFEKVGYNDFGEGIGRNEIEKKYLKKKFDSIRDLSNSSFTEYSWLWKTTALFAKALVFPEFITQSAQSWSSP